MVLHVKWGLIVEIAKSWLQTDDWNLWGYHKADINQISNMPYLLFSRVYTWQVYTSADDISTILNQIGNQ